MTVSELIELLKTMPPDAKVYGYTNGDKNGGLFEVERVQLGGAEVPSSDEVVIEGDV